MSDSEVKTLKSFARIISVALCALFGILLPWIWSYQWPIWPWILAGILMLTSMIKPLLLRGLHKYWYSIAEVIGRFNSRIILGLIFFVMMTPVALFLRLIGKRPLTQKSQINNGSYCQPATSRDKSHFEKPF